MQNPRCDKCGDEAKVREGILLLCSHCWLNQYMKLSRKETQRYGNGPYDRNHARRSISYPLK